VKEGVTCSHGLDCELEAFVLARVAHVDSQAVVGAITEEGDLDAVVLAVIKFGEESLSLIVVGPIADICLLLSRSVDSPASACGADSGVVPDAEACTVSVAT
jgi:hypothetical protein